MALTLAERVKILQEIINMGGTGEANVLKSKWKTVGLAEETIEDTYKSLGLVGVIRNGYDGLGTLRFKLTDFGKEYCESFQSFQQIKQELTAIKNNL